jgi:hypothetical protein
MPVLFDRSFDNSVLEYSSSNICLSENLVLPIEIEICTIREYEPYLRRRTQKSALETAREIAKEKLYLASKNFRTADLRESFEIVDGCLVYECTFEGIENIAKELEFELL